MFKMQLKIIVDNKKIIDLMKVFVNT